MSGQENNKSIEVIPCTCGDYPESPIEIEEVYPEEEYEEEGLI